MTSQSPQTDQHSAIEANDLTQAPNTPAEALVPSARRSFLTTMIGVMAAAITAVMGVVLGGFSLVPAFKKRSDQREWLDLALLEEIPDNQPVKKALVISQDAGWGQFNTQHLVWVLKKGTYVVVYSAVCPHLNCTINTAENGFICPCHGSAWDQSGRRLGGPTPRALDTLEYKIEGGMIKVKYQLFKSGIPEKEVM
ncbi:MAG: Rieske 2Fe-2S domain-containing protein [candidate division WOR-3 bacterium]